MTSVICVLQNATWRYQSLICFNDLRGLNDFFNYSKKYKFCKIDLEGTAITNNSIEYLQNLSNIRIFR